MASLLRVVVRHAEAIARALALALALALDADARGAGSAGQPPLSSTVLAAATPPTTKLHAAAATTSGCDANTALFGAGFEPGDASPMRLSVCRRNISVPSRSRVSDSVSRSRSAARVRTTSRFAALDAARAKNNALSACCQLAMVSSWLRTNPKYPPPVSAIPHIPKQLSSTSQSVCSRKRWNASRSSPGVSRQDTNPAGNAACRAHAASARWNSGARSAGWRADAGTVLIIKK